MLTAGVRRQLEFQDLAYAREYLERMKALRPGRAPRRRGAAMGTCAAARYLATAMAYDDVIRVADLKTRATRFERVRKSARVRTSWSTPPNSCTRAWRKSAAPCPPGGRWLKTRLRRLRRAPPGLPRAAARWAAS